MGRIHKMGACAADILNRGREIKQGRYLLAMLALAALRLLMVSCQSVVLYPEVSMLDDMLMYRAAVSISGGGWLGAYGYLTMGKHMLFSCWLALINAVGIPYLLASQLLWLATVAALVRALAPAVKHDLMRLVLFGLLIFIPSSYADFTLRVYRDSVSVSVFLWVFAGIIGYALRCCAEKRRRLWPWALLGGLGLGCSYLIREDGWWVLPFFAVGAAVAGFQIFKTRASRPVLRLVPLAASLAAAALCVGLYAYANYASYGLFAVSDLTSGPFKDAYGAMTRVVSEDKNPIVPLPKEARSRLYDLSPAVAELEQYLESNSFLRWQKDCGDGYNEYSGGGMYWALRDAASRAGYYESPQTAAAYWERVAAEVNAACETGLVEASGPRSGLNAPLSAEYVLPTIKESLKGLFHIAFYWNLSAEPELSPGSETAANKVEEYIGERAVKTEKSYNGDGRLELWAVSEAGVPKVELLDAAGEPVGSNDLLTTCGDIYLDYLFEGHDLNIGGVFRRHTLTWSPDKEPTAARLLLGGKSELVELEVCGPVETESGITYSVEYVGEDYSAQPSFGFLELWLYRGMRLLGYLWRALGAVMLLASLCSAAKLLGRKRQNKVKEPGGVIPGLIVLGLALMALLRVAMVSFAEVSAFNIGTSHMYLAAAYPLLLTAEFLFIYLSKESRSTAPVE